MVWTKPSPFMVCNVCQFVSPREFLISTTYCPPAIVGCRNTGDVGMDNCTLQPPRMPPGTAARLGERNGPGKRGGLQSGPDHQQGRLGQIDKSPAPNPARLGVDHIIPQFHSEAPSGSGAQLLYSIANGIARFVGLEAAGRPRHGPSRLNSICVEMATA